MPVEESIAEINPYVTVNLHQERLDSGNALEIFEPYDLILDGTDNFATRYLVNDACVLLGKPYVWGSIYRFEGQASVFWAEPKGGTQEGVPDISIWFSTLEPGSTQWSAPEQLSDDSTRSEQNPILFQAPKGPLWLLWTAFKGYYGPDYYMPVEMSGLYWHFVDIVWVFLFPLLYLIGAH